MTTAFADYVAQQDARNDIQLNITKYCYMLCDALLDNYHQYSIRSHQAHIAQYGDSSTGYHAAEIEKLKQGTSEMIFYVDTARKYHKIMMNTSGSISIHAFVDRKTGEVFKPASIKGPAKGVRFNLLIITEREWLFKNADWAGSYLYRR